MSDDWKPGDLALCVRGGEITDCDCGGCHAAGWRAGETLVVTAVGYGPAFGHTICHHPALRLSGGRNGLARRFRKIHPHTPDAEDAETIRLLNGAPVKEPVS